MRTSAATGGRRPTLGAAVKYAPSSKRSAAARPHFGRAVTSRVPALGRSVQLPPSPRPLSLAAMPSRRSCASIYAAASVTVRFTLPNGGDNPDLKIVGNHPKMGNWAAETALPLNQGGNGEWYTDVVLEEGETVYFKYLSGNQWEDCGDRFITVPSGSSGTVDVRSLWGSTDAPVEVSTNGAAAPAAPAAPTVDPSTITVPEELLGVRAYIMWEEAGNPDGADFGDKARAELQRAMAAGHSADELLRRLKSGKGVPAVGDAPVASAPAPAAAAQPAAPAPARDAAPAPAPAPAQVLESGDYLATKGSWVGKEINFMRSNDHSRDRNGVWETGHLQGGAVQLVDGDRRAASWREKLAVVADLLKDDAGEDRIAYAGIYLTWIASGQITCVEGGGHYRPNRHAELSRDIFRVLERVSPAGGCSGETLVACRRVHPKLPAFKAEFTASVPLTRIRDIAHRSDIPHDLKQEIKHTLQNKLHRNAGPEDLVATEAMLERIVKGGPQRDGGDGQYPEDFVREFRTFHKELKDFFNASSLEERLAGIRDAMGGEASLVDLFVSAKAQLDGGSAGVDGLLATLEPLTALRAEVARRAGEGAAWEADDGAVAMYQQWRLSEIGLEDYAFVLLSRLVNELEGSGVSDAAWPGSLAAAALATRNVGIGGWDTHECDQVANELGSLATRGSLNLASDEGLMVKAALDRARRVSEEYSDCALRVFAGRAADLGRALGVDEHSVRVFAESEIRASVVFQLAKLCSLMLKSQRSSTGAAAWDTLVSGSASGTLMEVDRIVPGALPEEATDGEVILIVKHADGDEEVTAAGAGVRGVMLQQELPHLSHLGVRARQEKVVFITGEDPELWGDVRKMIGQRVTLSAGPDGVSIKAAEGGAAPAPPPPVAAAPPPAPEPVAPPPPPPAPVAPPPPPPEPVAPPPPPPEAVAPPPPPPPEPVAPPPPPPPVVAPPPEPVAPPPPVEAEAEAEASTSPTMSYEERARKDASNPFAKYINAGDAPVTEPPASSPAAIEQNGHAAPPPAPPAEPEPEPEEPPAPVLPPLPAALVAAKATLMAGAPEEEAEAELRGLLDAGMTLEQLEMVLLGAPSKPAAPAAGASGSGPAPAVAPGAVTMSPGGTVLSLKDTTPDKGGAKSSSCAQLLSLASVKQYSSDAVFGAPRGCCLPFGAMEAAVDVAGAREVFDGMLVELESAAVGPELDAVCERMQALVGSLRAPLEVVAAVAEQVSGDPRLIVRSSANVEDLAGMSAAGLYESIPNVRTSEPDGMLKAIAEVWASLYSRRAVLSRRAARAPEREACMSVLVQELLSPRLSFVLHTVNPSDNDARVLYAEVAVGLGETLAAGTRGTPWRITANKETGEVKTLALANLSEAMVVAEDGPAAGQVKKVTVDYTQEPLSNDPEARAALGRRLAAIGTFLEQVLGGAQDVEGCVVGDEIFIVQSRPQP